MAARSGKSKISNTQLFNIAGWGVILLAGYMVISFSLTPKPETPLCEARYAGGVLFSYTRQGKDPLSPEDLQSRLGGKDRGLLNNLKIVKEDGVPQGYAMEVQLKRSSGAEEDDQARSGIGFTWTPRKLVSATAACLSYSVWTAPDFKMGDGGVLPGLVSDMGWPEDTGRMQSIVSPPKSADEDDKLPMFSTRLQWRHDGTLMLWQAPNIGQPAGVVLDPAKWSLKPGQWTRIEEEVVLNTPGKTDGVIRVWVNGKIAIERFDIGFRKDETQSFQAVIADIHHLKHGAWAAAPAEAKVRLSPLELRYK